MVLQGWDTIADPETRCGRGAIALQSYLGETGIEATTCYAKHKSILQKADVFSADCRDKDVGLGREIFRPPFRLHKPHR